MAQQVRGRIRPVGDLKFDGSVAVDFHAVYEGRVGDVDGVVQRVGVNEGLVGREVAQVIRSVHGAGGIDEPDAFNRRVKVFPG